MGLVIFIEVSFSVSGVHWWPEATGAHEYLKHPHRHQFQFNVSIEARHDDRELEFLAVLDFINEKWMPRNGCTFGSMSCEMIGESLLDVLMDEYGKDRLYSVSVHEDGENGAVLQWTP